MDEKQAKMMAKALGGDTWQSGGDVWLVLKRTSDGRIVSFSDESVVEYASETDFEEGKQKSSIVIV
jgi:hypothetical protein